MVEEALAMVDGGGAQLGPALVVASDRWAPGVVGIVAAKLVDKYQRPAFVLAVDAATGVARGSARTAGGVDLYRALGQCAPMLERWGGHAAAAGLTLRAEDPGGMTAAIDRLRDALGAAVLADGSGKVVDLQADADIELGLVDERLADELGGLAPFGQENPAPLLVARGLQVRSSRKVGDGSHLKLEVACPSTGAWRGAIAFGQGADDPGEGARIDVAFTPSRSSWNGKTRVELEVKRIVRAGEMAAGADPR
jgi:single-stranded-DNA-specific exonuclease